MAILDVKNVIQSKLTSLGLLGSYSYGALTTPAIMIIPDPQWGNDPPEILNGNQLNIQGIEVVIADTLEGLNITPLINSQALMEYEYAVLIKDWSEQTNAKLKQVLEAISGLLFVVNVFTPPFDKAVLPRVCILTVADPVIALC